ncbi:YciI family protein [Phytohabitans kaempferiae]|uniref:YciI family protein n=1 Tax=Phytohabitans kaempferiae TaxID=1620943 RepID=A0ABV6LUU5_9ACTN
MKYVCLFYADEARVLAMSQAEVDALIDETTALEEDLRASGQLVVGQALEQVESAVTVRVRDGRLSATDGPFAETNEQLGGFMLIEARDLDEAIQIAGRIPSARLGSIEVRPAFDLMREHS